MDTLDFIDVFCTVARKNLGGSEKASTIYYRSTCWSTQLDGKRFGAGEANLLEEMDRGIPPPQEWSMSVLWAGLDEDLQAGKCHACGAEIWRDSLKRYIYILAAWG
mmetsp:Transcript_17953/g.25450  ORF Transcript_17953/g.25450 Transcript_17953/m.25450 type:complete len:106 (+) Transcript_17953:285-602(+)|eukprot:CAMPEP_0201688354 /NCGR_PEP_ID=MMETSP0578-20130828/2118_1 /ASSEMBLY_ACC=CAM_ASM_000663 /TAXON_ID=267565 /ORGANISM="Skeletonema grethea, Strain CCMP 1804" /LENGTH=105 /DNA_ID=CAMNT_0048172639 /DNA_START=215 /DNA_END=532 /DNA_ORIENTATION=-